MTRKTHFRPFAKKSLGQNFLSDPNYVRKIIDALGVLKEELVVEIGPGRGALTGELLARGARVLAVELDRDLVPELRERFAGTGMLEVLLEDALEVDFRALVGLNRKAKLVANLPYYISTAILQHLAGERDSFSSAVLMLQKEVVERITAKPGDSERGYLTVLVEAYFESEKLFDVPPSAFRPAPKVWSSIVRLTPRTTDLNGPVEDRFRRLVSAGFAQKRKTILNNLKQSGLFAGTAGIEAALSEAGIDPSRRAETLALPEWRALAESAGPGS